MSRILVAIASIEDAEPAIKSGADGLVIDAPCLSFRSPPAPGYDYPSFFDSITRLKHQYAHITIDLNIDILIHDEHIPQLDALVLYLQAHPVSGMHIQDPGLIGYFKTQIPDLKRHYHAKMGNSNTDSITHLFEVGAHSQCLNNELTHHEIRAFQSLGPFGCQVQGPILIQYAKRRFQSDYLETPPNELFYSRATDLDSIPRQYQFVDSPHGHLMYAHFHRCLALAPDLLCGLNLDYWLIDGHDQSLAYIQEATQLYTTLNTTGTTQPPSADDYPALFKTAQKLGFFLHNRSDEDWRNDSIDQRLHKAIIGDVIESKKEHYCIIQCRETLPLHTPLTFITPDHHHKKVTLSQYNDLSNMTYTCTPETQVPFVKIPWVRGVSPGTRICLQSDITP